MQLEISKRNIVFTPFELTVNSHLDYIYIILQVISCGIIMAQQLLQVQNMSASHRQVSCPRVRLGWGVCGSTKGGRGEVRLGNSIYSEHDSKDMLVTYRVCED